MSDAPVMPPNEFYALGCAKAALSELIDVMRAKGVRSATFHPDGTPASIDLDPEPSTDDPTQHAPELSPEERMYRARLQRRRISLGATARIVERVGDDR